MCNWPLFSHRRMVGCSWLRAVPAGCDLEISLGRIEIPALRCQRIGKSIAAVGWRKIGLDKAALPRLPAVGVADGAAGL